jgi:hypothetical protein
MKKLCKLFWKNDVLGKWIVYDSETKKVLEVKKFDQEGKETHVHLLEQGMLNKGVLELDHSIKIWEVELVMAEVPQITMPPLPTVPTLPEPSDIWDRIITTDRTVPRWPSDGIVYGGGSTTTYTTTFGGSSQGDSQANGYASNMSYVAAATMPRDTVLLVGVHPHDKFLAAINHLAVGKDYRREDEELSE